MSISSINNNTVSGASNTNSANSTSKSNSTLTMDDFFSLMVAQLKNQDMYNTMDDSQFIAQMAQFSMVQALADLSQASATAYGVGLIGKEVTIATTAADGTINSLQGIVDSVNLYNGSAQVVVDGKSYALSNVMSVKEPDLIMPNADITENSADTTTDSVNSATDAADAATDTADTTSDSTDTTSGSGI